jgi:beta-galactosidase
MTVGANSGKAGVPLPPARKALAFVAGLVAAVPILSACAGGPDAGTLQPTLSLQRHSEALVAVQNEIPVPTFEWQPRPRLSLDGQWRVEQHRFDANLTLTDRGQSLDSIVAEAGGREGAAFNDSAWSKLAVPGALNLPPNGAEVGAWYRSSVVVPQPWLGSEVLLKFGSVNYVADVWLNGGYLGYHEGGYTPFAFDVTDLLRPGVTNVIAVRVDNPPWGTRNDIVPWGLTDWWNYGGITGSVWLEAMPALHVVRADVVPHLDGADVSIVTEYSHRAATGASAPAGASVPATVPPPVVSGSGPSSPAPEGTRVLVDVLPAQVTPDNVANPDVRSLVAVGAAPLAHGEAEIGSPRPGDVDVAEVSFQFSGADTWSPSFPALFVLRVTLESEGVSGDVLWTSFGLRRIAVDPEAPRLLLNGRPIFLDGVGLHDETMAAVGDGMAIARPAPSASELLAQLERARALRAALVRTGHTPANPTLLMLADRLGFAVWEEIPVYHFTPATFQIALERGIAQQMVREMALRDMNHPSVLFHGLANESTGEQERTDALTVLRDADREIDGTRLTGQAAYGSIPGDSTQDPLDVAGYTFYYGVFYGTDPAGGTANALALAHAAHPAKPIMALEFGRWADSPVGEARQRQIFAKTFQELRVRRDSLDDGFVGAAVWWALDDFATQVPGIRVERFGLYDPSGRRRPAGDLAAVRFSAMSGAGSAQRITSDMRSARAEAPEAVDLRFVALMAYALAVSMLLLLAVLYALVRLRGADTPSVPRAP